MIEIYKHQFQRSFQCDRGGQKPELQIYYLYGMTWSFEEFEVEYKFLKAVIEGGVETKPDNVLIYATSNRRHLIKGNLERQERYGARQRYAPVRYHAGEAVAGEPVRRDHQLLQDPARKNILRL